MSAGPSNVAQRVRDALPSQPGDVGIEEASHAG